MTGSRETRLDLLFKHLFKHPRHGNSNWHQGSVSGEVWHADYLRRKTNLEKQLYQSNNNASEEQRKAYELLFGRSGFKAQNVCLVGVGGAGKTWIAQKLSKLLQCVFFNPGEVIRSAPLGRQACRFHPDARTIHSIIRLRPNAKHKYPESLSEIQDHLKTSNSDSFNCVKVLIVSEAFMCNSPHLEALLVHIKNVSPCCIFLFDGDCLQLAMKATPNYPASPFLTRDRFQEVCPNTQIIVFEKCMKYRIRNAVKLAHMDKMRLGVAQQDTIDYLKKAMIPKEQHPVLRVFANAHPAAEFNETQLNLILGKSKSLTVTVLQAKEFWTDSKIPTRMSTNEEHSLSVDANIKVVQGAPILIVQNHLAEKCFGQQQGQKLHVGNGTTGFFREYDRETDSIIVDVEFADKKEYVRIKRWNFCTETKTRSQFPIMLAWAATIQKVQGMEFKSLEVDFCLNYYAIPSSGSSDFFQGCAYMVFTRAETVKVIGDITLPLLNNVNLWCLQWWKLQVSLWNDFKKGNSTQKSLLFRNAIHQHNWHAAQLQKIANDRKQANASASVTAPTLALVPAIPASASASAPAPAPASASASSSALTTAPAPAHATAPRNKRQVLALDFEPTPAPPSKAKAKADQVVAASKRRKNLPKIEAVVAIVEVTAVVAAAATAAVAVCNQTKPSLRRDATLKLLQDQSC